MANDSIEKMMQEIASLRRQVGGMFRQATVHEVKGDKMRMVIGKGKDGKEVLGPWLDTVNHRGGATERKFYKKGQNLTLMCPNGDLAQAIVTPFAPNKDFKPPKHANESGQDEETYEQENLRVRKTKKGYAIWLEDDEQEQEEQEGAEGSAGGGGDEKEGVPEKHKPKKPKPIAIINLAKDGGFTAKVGKDSDAMRVAVTKDGAKLKAGESYVSATKDSVSLKSKKVLIQADDKLSLKSDGEFIVNGKSVFVRSEAVPLVEPPWQIGGKDAEDASDSVQDDDNVTDESTSEEGSGGESGGEAGV